MMIKDRVRGSLMAGAMGDALGYVVEFMPRQAIVARYGERGITQFELDGGVKALISDDTQMTLYTAIGLTNAKQKGIEPKYAIAQAYIEWLNTQLKKGPKGKEDCWISKERELYSRRAPGFTCMSALSQLAKGGEPINDSKGCGGIMRVAPIGLYGAVGGRMTIEEVGRLAVDAVELTHQHPLGYLSSALFAMFIYRVVQLPVEYLKANIGDVACETLDVLDSLYDGRFDTSRAALRSLTEMALSLARTDMSDADAVKQLGEGWTGDEAWAIALYSAVRHVDSVEMAIEAAVNHNGDSDSTGSVCGNIIGAIHGYEHLKMRNIFCPEGHTLEDSLELSRVILRVADTLIE